LLESTRVFPIKRVQTVRIYVENGDQITPLPENWYYYLGLRSRVTGDVPRIFVDVADDHGLSSSSGITTHTSAECDVEAAEAPLVWADTKELTRLDHTVKARPQMAECVVQERGDRSHRGDFIIDAIEDRIRVPLQLGIGPSFRYLPEIGDCFRHVATAQ
jgi:hypothetical protein